MCENTALNSVLSTSWLTLKFVPSTFHLKTRYSADCPHTTFFMHVCALFFKGALPSWVNVAEILVFQSCDDEPSLFPLAVLRAVLTEHKR